MTNKRHLSTEQLKSRKKIGIAETPVYIPMVGGPLGGVTSRHDVDPVKHTPALYRCAEGQYVLVDGGRAEQRYVWEPHAPQPEESNT